MENGKRVRDSALQSCRWMFPSDANPAGNVFGGTIVRYIDEIAGVVAHRHARCNVVLASIDRVDFHAPVKIGDLLTFKASINYVGNTSMEVGVRVEAENMMTGVVVHAVTAYAIMVALDKKGKPIKVPPLITETAEEKRRYQEGELRRQRRTSQRP